MKETELNILSLVSKDISLFTEAKTRLTPMMFELYGEIWAFIIKYFEEYRKLPTKDVYKSLSKTDERWISKLEVIDEFSSKEVDKDSFLFFCNELIDQYAGRAFLSKVEKSVQNMSPGKNLEVIRGLKEELGKIEVPRDNLKRGLAFELVSTKELNEEEKIPTGILGLDNELSGFYPGELVVLVGRWGSGKTTFLLNLAYNAWLMKQINVLFLSLEMPLRRMQEKFLARHTGLSYTKIRDGTLFDFEQIEFSKKVEESKCNRGSITIIDFPRNCTLNDIEGIIASSNKRVELLVVDYLGLIRPERKTRGDDWQILGEISSSLRAIGRFYNVPVLTAHQIGRNNKNDDGTTREVQLEQLWRSYEISHHTDIAVGINLRKLESERVLEILKSRYGRAGGKCSVYFDGDRCIVQTLGVGVA